MKITTIAIALCFGLSTHYSVTAMQPQQGRQLGGKQTRDERALTQDTSINQVLAETLIQRKPVVTVLSFLGTPMMEQARRTVVRLVRQPRAEAVQNGQLVPYEGQHEPHNKAK